MSHLRSQRWTVGGTAVGAVFILSISWLSCQPGSLPCDKDSYKDACETSNTSGGGSGGSGGSGTNTGTGGSTTPIMTADAGSGAGGKGGTGGSGMASGAALSDSTPIPGCDAYKTLGDMDNFFGMRCGVAANCHVAALATAWNDLKTAQVWMRLKDASSHIECVPGKMIDSGNWENSVIWAKTKNPVACGSGAPKTGVTMPPQAMMPTLDPLSDSEIACLQGFLKTVAAGK